MKLKTLNYFFVLLLTISTLNAFHSFGQEAININPLTNNNTSNTLKLKVVKSLFNSGINDKKFNDINNDHLEYIRHSTPINTSKRPAFYFGIGIYKSFPLNNTLKGETSFMISGNILFKLTNFFFINTGIDYINAQYSNKPALGINLIPTIGVSEDNMQFSFGLGIQSGFAKGGVTLNPLFSFNVEYYFRKNIAWTIECKNPINYANYINLMVTSGITILM